MTFAVGRRLKRNGNPPDTNDPGSPAREGRGFLVGKALPSNIEEQIPIAPSTSKLVPSKEGLLLLPEKGSLINW